MLDYVRDFRIPTPGSWSTAIVWQHIRSNRTTLCVALAATLIVASSLLLVWVPQTDQSPAMDRLGHTLANTMASSSAGQLLRSDRIELAVIANRIAAYDEVSGVVFYDQGNEILAMAGATELRRHYIAAATMDDTITGYVALDLNPAAFTPPTPWWAWLVSLLCIGLAPFLSVIGLQLYRQGNRSLPIVSVPEPTLVSPQESFCLIVNLHNQLALNRQQRTLAIEDAAQMAAEVCAIHSGVATAIGERGVMLLFDHATVTAREAVFGAFLVQALLEEFETHGEFRCMLVTVASRVSAAESVRLSVEDLDADFDLDAALTLASLAKPHSLLLSASARNALADLQWSHHFDHPLLDDLTHEAVYEVNELPDVQAELVAKQAELILGFNQAATVS